MRSVTRLKTAAPHAPLDPRVGSIVGITDEGEVLVDFPGNPGGPCVARSTVDLPADIGTKLHAASVLLIFERGDASLPIILGLVRDARISVPFVGEFQASGKRRRDIRVDGESLVFDGRREILLRCGKASITLRADGTVVVRGTDVLSRSSGTNRIKGAAVRIN
jgi:hypothetical protein